MNIFHDIRNQPPRIRLMMFALSVMTTISLVGLLWFNSFEHDLYVLLNSEEDYQQTFLAKKKELQEPTLLSYIGGGFQNLQAAIYGLLSIDDEGSSADKKSKDAGPLLLPLSDERQGD